MGQVPPPTREPLNRRQIQYFPILLNFPLPSKFSPSKLTKNHQNTQTLIAYPNLGDAETIDKRFLHVMDFECVTNLQY